MKYFALLTKLGENLLAQATALGTKIELTQMAVGDGGGSLPTPDTNQTKLIAEKRRAAINTLFIDDKNKNQIIAEQIIPEQEGGWWIREIGLFDKAGNLIAVANCPETYKPQLAEGSGRTQSIRMVLVVSHTESVTLKIDPSVVLATREYVNTEITVLDKKIDALSAQTKLDLNKKFDKANISGQKGNDNDKVPSLGLFTTETGKLQPKGDYATKDEVNKKLDTSGGAVTGPLNVQRLESNRLSGANKQIMSASTNAVYVGNPTDVSEIRLQTNNGNVRVDIGSASYSAYHEANVRKDPKGYLCGLSSNGEVLLVGENGIGTEVTFKNVPRDSEGWPFGSVGGGQMLSPPNSAAFQAVLCWTKGGTFRLSGRTSNASGAPGDFVEFYSTGNTKIDRNGYIRTSNTTEDMQSVPIGASVIWNSSAPIPSNFWPNEGRSFSAAEYPELAKVFTNLKVPDDRGYGIRVADNGKGIDTGRTVGTYQEDAVQSVTGSVRNLAATSADYQYAGAFFGSDKGGIEYASGSSGQRFRTLEFDIGRVARTANETRMKNVAKILITRVK